MNGHRSHTIYVGNIQSIDDETLRSYFQRFGPIEEFFHTGSRAADEWLIDYRFIRFSSETDINVFLTNQIDHTICRIRLDIHSYETVFNPETRLTSDRKVCIAHTNPKLDRNIIKKVKLLIKSFASICILLFFTGIYSLRSNLKLYLCFIWKWRGICLH